MRVHQVRARVLCRMPRRSGGGHFVPGAAVQLAACGLLADPVNRHGARRKSIRLQEVVQAAVQMKHRALGRAHTAIDVIQVGLVLVGLCNHTGPPQSSVLTFAHL